MSVTLSKLYDEWKPLKCVSIFFLLIPSNTLSLGASKVQHWWVYDPDGNGRKFASEGDFVNHQNAKWKFMYPYSCHTHRLKANFSYIPRSGSEVTTGIKKMDNPWRNISEWSNGTASKLLFYSTYVHITGN